MMEMSFNPDLNSDCNNTKVKVDPKYSNEDLGNSVDCRHLAIGYYKYPDFLDHVQTQDGIKTFFSEKFPLNKAHQTFLDVQKTESKNKQLISNDLFGAWLKDVVVQMQTQNLSQTAVLIDTVEHSMALRIKLEESKGKIKIRLSCYDPNATGNHKEGDAYELEELSDVKITDCFNGMQDNFTHQVDLSGICITATCCDVKLTEPKQLQYLSDTAYKEAFKQAIVNNIPEVMEVLGQIFKSNGMSAREMKELLEEQDYEKTPPLYQAYDRGYAGVIEKTADLICKFRITAKSAISIFQAIDSEQTPGFSLALGHDDYTTMEALKNALRKVGMENHNSKTIFEATNRDGENGIDYAGDMEFKKTYEDIMGSYSKRRSSRLGR